MKATHTNYKHPKHLRVEDDANVWCMAPSHSQYSRLNKPSLPCHIATVAQKLVRFT